MKAARPRSLQWLLVRRLILLQAAMLAIFIALCAAALWISNPHWLVDNEAAVQCARGRLNVRALPERGRQRRPVQGVDASELEIEGALRRWTSDAGV